VHFGYVVAYLQTSGEPLEMVTLTFGGLAFLLTWIMAVTSNNTSQRALKAWWRRIHTLGIYYVWLIFMNTFIGVLLATSDPLYVGIVAVGLVAVSLRMAVFLRQRFSRTA
jgi:sulfoxide reductase heme-binding subunit YedZ